MVFDRIKSFEIVAQSIGGESGEPQSDLGSLLCESIRLSIPNDSAKPSDVIISYATEWPHKILVSVGGRIERCAEAVNGGTGREKSLRRHLAIVRFAPPKGTLDRIPP
jgi:hypothetical protein